MKYRKSKTVLTIFLMLMMLILVSAVSAIFLIDMAASTFISDSRNFDVTLDRTAVMLEREIEQNSKVLHCYAQTLREASGWTSSETQEKLQRLDDETYTYLILVLADGTEISSGDMTLGQQELDGVAKELGIWNGEEKKSFYFGACRDNYALCAVPVSFDNSEAGALIGIVPANWNLNLLNTYSQPEGSDDMRVYLLNDKSESVLFSGDDGRTFEYSSIERNLFYHGSGNILDQAGYVMDKLGESEPYTVVSESVGSLSILFRGEARLWYEKPLSVDGNQEWKLVAGRAVEISDDSRKIIITCAIFITFVILFFFIIMVAVVISKGTSNWRLEKLAYVDLVTNCPNWTRFQLESQKLLKKRKKNKQYMIVSMDIRNFRILSELDNGKTSDSILKMVADALRRQMRKNEKYARFAVDEFAMLLEFSGEAASIVRVEEIDARLKAEISVDRISFCYGIYPVTDASMPVQKMYNYAGIARDSVKSNPEKYMEVFNDSMWNQMLYEKELESHMEDALLREEFKVYLQPKYKADGTQVGGAEALVRWVSPELGFISPGAFIPLFERNGFIMKLDNYMLDHVCAMQRKWIEAGKELVTISVNLSRIHLLDPELVPQIIAMIDGYKIPHDCIELELTESAFFDDKQVLLDTVIRLRQEGFIVSMDDFGSGYSSLNSLKDLPLDVVKLDGEFFRHSEDQSRSEMVIRDTISLAKHLNMKIVAEGIETEEQVRFLEGIGCDLIQGYYFARPMPVEDFERLMGWYPKSAGE